MTIFYFFITPRAFESIFHCISGNEKNYAVILLNYGKCPGNVLLELKARKEDANKPWYMKNSETKQKKKIKSKKKQKRRKKSKNKQKEQKIKKESKNKLKKSRSETTGSKNMVRKY